MTTDAITTWAAAGLREVELPTGTRVRLRIPGPADLLRSKVMPAELRKMALKFATAGIDTDDLDEKSLDSFLEFQDRMVCTAVRQVWDGEAWEDVALTPETLETAGIPAEDRGAIAEIALRSKTPAMVTAQSRSDRGLLDDETLLRVTEEEAAATGPGWESFRGQPGSDSTRATSGTVGLPAEQHARAR